MLSFQVGPLIIKIHLDKDSSEELVWFTYQIAYCEIVLLALLIPTTIEFI